MMKYFVSRPIKRFLLLWILLVGSFSVKNDNSGNVALSFLLPTGTVAMKNTLRPSGVSITTCLPMERPRSTILTYLHCSNDDDNQEKNHPNKKETMTYELYVELQELSSALKLRGKSLYRYDHAKGRDLCKHHAMIDCSTVYDQRFEFLKIYQDAVKHNINDSEFCCKFHDLWDASTKQTEDMRQIVLQESTWTNIYQSRDKADEFYWIIDQMWWFFESRYDFEKPCMTLEEYDRNITLSIGYFRTEVQEGLDKIQRFCQE